MKHSYDTIKSLFLNLGMVFFSLSLYAGTPLWTLSPNPNFPPSVSVNSNGTGTIQYTVTNRSIRPHILAMKAIPGITQQLGSGYCGSSFTLPSKGSSCVLSLQATGSQLQGAVLGGPIVCQVSSNSQPGTQCYQPSPADELNITLVPSSTLGFLSTVSCLDGGSICVNGGSEFDSSADTYPYLGVSSNVGDIWSSILNNDVLPPDGIALIPNGLNYSAGIYASDCSPNTFCLVAGGYGSTSTPYAIAPLLTKIDSSGVVTYPISAISTPTPSSLSLFEILQTVSCTTGGICVTAGYYLSSSDGNIYPVLAKSTSGGSSWTYEIDDTTNTVPDDVNFGVFQSAKCFGTFCFVAGGYWNGQVQSLLLALQNETIAPNWSYVVYAGSSPGSGLPSNMASGGPNGSNVGYQTTTCGSSSYCLAAGNYWTTNNPPGLLPLLTYTNNGGNNASSPISGGTGASLPPGASQDTSNGPKTFLSSSCGSAQFCVAGGRYHTNAGYYPFLAQGLDVTNWTFPIANGTSINGLQADPSVSTQSGFNGINCTSSSSCLAVGSYFNGQTYSPLIARTVNTGVSWQIIVDSATTSFTSSLPANFVLGGFNSVTCSANKCIAVGYYQNSSTENFPLKALSSDSGATWTYSP